MEFSSPLAAMRPQPAGGPNPWGHRKDLPPFRSTRSIGPNSFNFGNMSTEKSGMDYFSSKSVRGSSPAASLAADLSQNFHIDQSPQLATPRRSLFSVFREPAAADREGAVTPPIRWEGVTTPPVPSSSPGYGNDMMDYSPLPHKAPTSGSIPQLQFQQPTPGPTPISDVEMMSPTVPTPNTLSVELKTFVLPERRKLNAPRPGLQRNKYFSTNTITAQRGVGPENQLPQFTFGAGKNGSFQTASTSLDECFQESPPQERKPLSNLSMGPPPRPRQLFSNVNGAFHRTSGSPLSGHIKKPVGPVRPKKIMRRSASMFEHPGDVMRQEKKDYAPSGLQSIMDIDDTHKLQLPHFIPEDNPDSLPRIDNDTMVDVLNGKYDDLYDGKVVIDCRFEYEFDGGHINGAEHHDNRDRLTQKLFAESFMPGSKKLLIFHCEYSEHRAPLMAKQIRQADRAHNAHQYPKLTYPEVYILNGGYKSFFTAHRSRCFPQNYVEMGDKNYEDLCDRGMHKVKQRGKFERSKTFAFGQCSDQIQDSPTAQPRGPRSLLPIDVASPLGAFDSPRPLHPSRRMLSY